MTETHTSELRELYHSTVKGGRVFNYEGQYLPANYSDEILTPFVQEVKETKPNPKVLDLGSGDGEIVNRLRFSGCNAYGVDIANVVNHPNAVQATAWRLPFGDNTFDALHSKDLFTHIPPHLRREVFNEIRRVVKPGGNIVIVAAENRGRRFRQFTTRRNDLALEALHAGLEFTSVSSWKPNNAWSDWYTDGRSRFVLNLQNTGWENSEGIYEKEDVKYIVARSRLNREARLRFGEKSNSLETFRAMQDWWFSDHAGIGDVIFTDTGFENIRLDQAVANTFLSAVSLADEYYDTHKDEFRGMLHDQIRSAMLNYNVIDGDNKVSVRDVISLVEEYAEGLQDAERKVAIQEALVRFMSSTFHALEWESSVDLSTYTYEEVLNHKRDTLFPYLEIAYAIGEKIPGKELQKIREISVILQLEDDIRDFEEDMAAGTVNMCIGLYNTERVFGQQDAQARIRAFDKANSIVKKEKLNRGYYIFGLRLLLIRRLKQLQRGSR